MRAHIIWLALLPLVLGSCYIFCDDGRPCTAQGECLPGYTCVEGLCRPRAEKQVGELCIETGECIDGAVCAEAFCDDSGNTACETPADCGEEGDKKYRCANGTCRCLRTCRTACDFPDFEKCQSGQLCYYDENQELGFCQEGNCGDREDGTSVGTCLNAEVCLIFNGKGSGICYPTCTILEQTLSCNNPPAPAGVQCCAANQNCEHLELLWGAPEHPDSGNIGEGSPCSNDPAEDAFCQRGMVCYGNFCRKYCRKPSGTPQCSIGYNCISFPGGEGLPYGWCRPQ